MNLSDLTPATPREIKRLKGIIYLIFNREKKKGYIGQSLDSFQRRYVNGKWWEYTKNPILKNISEEESKKFDIYLLEHNKTLKERNTLEPFYIGELNTLYPNGYNFQLGGECKGALMPSTKQLLSEANSKTYTIYKNGQPIFIENMTKFCQSIGIGATAMFNMINGRTKSCKGYTINKKAITNLQHDNFYVFIHPKHGKRTVQKLKELEQEFGVKASSLRGLLVDYVKSCHGWTLCKEESLFTINSSPDKGKKYNKIVIQNKNDGKEKTFHNPQELAKFLNIATTTIISWLNGSKTSISEWIVKYKEKSSQREIVSGNGNPLE